MKKFKLGFIASILAVALLAGCGGDERVAYIEALEAADQTTILGLGTWMVEHEESIIELFEIDEIHTDREGEELEWETVRHFEDHFLDHWSFEADGEYITFTFVWDYEAATARSPLFDEHLEWAIGRIDAAMSNFEMSSTLTALLAFDLLNTAVSDSLPNLQDDEIFFLMTEFSLHLGSILDALDGQPDISALETVEEAFGPRFEEMREELEALR